MSDLRSELREQFRDEEYRRIYCESFQNSWIASQLKAVREQRNLTQARLAELADMKQARISVLEDVNYESWNVNTLRRLANALDCDLHVRFVPYSATVQDAANFGTDVLTVPKFEEDPFFSETAPLATVLPFKMPPTSVHAYTEEGESTSQFSKTTGSREPAEREYVTA